MPCPGSVGLSDGVPSDEDNEFSAPGTAAHALAEAALQQEGDAWEYIGQGVNAREKIIYLANVPEDAILIDKDMADAVQVYLSAVREWHPDRNQGNTWIERRFHCPTIHKYHYGTADLVHLDKENKTLHVWDYKHGAGIVVEAKMNVQVMYYACGVLEDLDLWEDVDRVTLHIAQPRGWHYDGPIRQWSISTDDLLEWMMTTLIPAMDRAIVSRDTTSGEHCRFCPVRGRKCPQIMADLDELEELVKKMNLKGKAVALNAEETGRLLTLMIPALIAKKQALKNATGMLNSGSKVPGWKLAKARSNRKFKDGAEAEAIKKFGKKKAFTTPELKSPAQIEAMPEGEAFNTRWAFKPNTGETVVPETDSRATVSKDTKSGFTPASKKGRK